MIKMIFQSLMMHKKKYVLTIIQFIICFFALIFAMSMIDDILQYRSRVEKIADLDLVHIYSLDEDIDYNPETTEPISNHLNEMLSKLEKESYIDKIGMFERVHIRDVKQSSSIEDINVIMASKELLEMSKIRLSKGEMDSLMEYQAGVTEIPVLVSSDLKEQYKLNEIYTYYISKDFGDECIKFVVKGFVESPAYFWRGNASDITSTLSSGDKFIICPQFQKYDIFSYMNNVLIKLNDCSKTNIELLEQYLESAEISYEQNTLRSEINEYYTRQKEIVVPVIIFATIILVLSLLGCIGVILCNLLSRKREFGVYYSLGLSKKKLMSILCGEILCVFTLSFLIASITCICVFSVGLWSMLIVLAIMFVCVFMCELVIVTKFSKIEIINLINENVRE